MSPELHEILSKATKAEDDDAEQPDAPAQVDDVRLEEETPLQQQEGEVQLKHLDFLKKRADEERPLQAKPDVEEAPEENTEGKDLEANKLEEKKEPEVKTEVSEKETEEKEEMKEGKTGEVAPAPAEPEKEDNEEKRDVMEEPKDDSGSPSSPKE